MTEQAYIVATLARGTASLGFTYRGRPGLQPGTLVAVSLRGKLEPGLVLAEDPAPPEQAKLLPLIELQHSWPRIGPLLGVMPDNTRDVDISDLRPLVPGGH